jgi:pilus assembly protein CpaB
MIARRLILALCVAILISGLFTYWLSRRFAKPNTAASTQLSYVATAKSLDAGQVLEPASLTMVNWPAGQPIKGAFLKMDDVVGRTVMYPLAGGEPVLDRQISAVGAGTGLSMRIPQGMRALSLKSDQVVGVAGYLLPGTRVDVLVTLHTPASAEPVTSTVLQDAQILTAGQKMQPDPDGKASTVDVVTLLVSPADAEKVVLASTQGSVHFVLRNSADHVLHDDPPTELSALGAAAPAKPLAKHAVTKATVAAPKAPKPYLVEVTRGDKSSVESF